MSDNRIEPDSAVTFVQDRMNAAIGAADVKYWDVRGDGQQRWANLLVKIFLLIREPFF